MNNLLLRRRALEGVKKGRLPSGYTEVEWIKPTDGCYIDTGLVGTQVNGCEVAFNSNGTMAWYPHLFNIGNDTSFGFWRYGNAQGKYIPCYNGARITSNFQFDASVKRTILFNNGVISLDGVQKITYTNQACAFNDSEQKLYLLKNNGIDNTLYHIKFFAPNNIDVVMDLIPCMNPQKEVGMYDLVSKTFFGNAGTGSFIAGNPVN